MTGPGGAGPPTPPGLPALWAPGFEPKWKIPPIFRRQRAFHRFFKKSKAFCPPDAIIL